MCVCVCLPCSVAFRGVFRGEGERVCPPLLFLDRVDGGVTHLFREQKFFMKTKGEASQWRFGVYILTRLSAMGVYTQWLLHGFQKMAKLRQKPFVKIDKTKIAISGQMLRKGAAKVNLIYPLDKFWRFVV